MGSAGVKHCDDALAPIEGEKKKNELNMPNVSGGPEGHGVGLEEKGHSAPSKSKKELFPLSQVDGNKSSRQRESKLEATNGGDSKASEYSPGVGGSPAGVGRSLAGVSVTAKQTLIVTPESETNGTTRDILSDYLTSTPAKASTPTKRSQNSSRESPAGIGGRHAGLGQRRSEGSRPNAKLERLNCAGQGAI